jgi:hypothetical protein
MAEHLAGTCAEPARPVISPVTAEHLADLPVVTADQIDRAFAASLPGLVPFGGAAGSRSGWGAGARPGPTARHDRSSGRDLQPGMITPHEGSDPHDVGVAHPDQSA